MPRARTIPDPAGHLPSDEHRRVLGHLQPPHLTGIRNERDRLIYEDNTSAGVFVRAYADPNVQADSQDEILEVLAELADLGLAKETVKHGWQMTRAGYTLIAGGIANEPGPLRKGTR